MTTTENGDLPTILAISDDYTYARYYQRHWDTGSYIYSVQSASWFCYDKNNVLTISTTKTPFRLKNEISARFVSLFRDLQHGLQEHETEAYNAIDKIIKHVGSCGFGDSICSFLRSMNNNNDLESLIDSDTSLIAFNNGVCCLM